MLTIFVAKLLPDLLFGTTGVDVMTAVFVKRSQVVPELLFNDQFTETNPPP